MVKLFRFEVLSEVRFKIIAVRLFATGGIARGRMFLGGVG